MTDGRRLTTTDGGLRVISEPLEGVRSIALGVWIGVGSRFEDDEQAGVSHFIEHLLFKGTPTHSAEEIAQIFDGLGGEVNAATGRDYTVVYTRVLDDHLERAFGVVGDMLQRPGFFELDQEREVVLEEILMYEDDPQDQVHDLISRAVFPRQALGRPVIGTSEVIGSVPEAGVRAYHREHYTAPNMVVAAAGHVDHDALVALASRVLGDLAREDAGNGFAPASAGPATLLVKEKATEQYHLCLGGPGLTRSDPRRHAMSVLDTLLGGSMSSRLFQEVRERRGLAYAVGSFTAGYADAGQVGVYLGTREENLVTASRVLGDELRRVGADAVPDQELQRAKDHLKGRMVLSLESPGTRMHRIGKAVLTDTELLSIDEIVARVDAVSADDVQALARDYWDPDALSAAVIGPSADAVSAAITELAPALAEAPTPA